MRQVVMTNVVDCLATTREFSLVNRLPWMQYSMVDLRRDIVKCRENEQKRSVAQ